MNVGDCFVPAVEGEKNMAMFAKSWLTTVQLERFDSNEGYQRRRLSHASFLIEELDCSRPSKQVMDAIRQRSDLDSRHVSSLSNLSHQNGVFTIRESIGIFLPVVWRPWKESRWGPMSFWSLGNPTVNGNGSVCVCVFPCVVLQGADLCSTFVCHPVRFIWWILVGILLMPYQMRPILLCRIFFVETDH